ncbi:hypothetical protein ERJ75_001710900 [Trypanosoma vivax]|uniref:RNA-binding protein, putative n=1 Tax=Trypanosoma vivax (strain Y486) TaxID=1055687 RepID=F9WMI3_TRYVY|nr:hypothetical protein ERJ75_001710900 [Trypanosoma vivax]CCD18740.1 RNA-binding protein, putative [Trypanosoma vivax Y486]|eukprot:CCD18740.1 RNA-binding protein, putative [Trypanosoma vivax Y486]
MEMLAFSSWRDSPVIPISNATANLSKQSPAVLPSTHSEKESSSKTQGHRPHRSKGRARNHPSQQHADVEDFFFNCVLPPNVTFATLTTELQLQAVTPLHVFDIGPPQLLLSKRTGGTGNAEPDGGAPVVGSTSDGGSRLADGVTPKTSCNESSAGRTPVTTETPLAASGVVVDDRGVMPGAAVPDLALPPSVPSEILQKGHLVSFLFAESSEAEKASDLLLKKWPHATVMIVPRNRALLNASLVIKGLPSLSKTESVIDELEKIMPHKPSYIRLHRGERGVFKNVIFLKYPNREIAEECKLRLERLYIGSRQLRVEFKKKEKTTVEREESVMLQQIVRDLRVSAEHEGFKYRRCELSKEDMKLLRQLCHSYGLVFEPGEKVVTVRRVLSASGRPSPALRPQSSSTATATQSATDAFRAMEFRGIRHWRELGSQQTSIGIVRPKEPDNVTPFAPGRGRPV